MKTSQRILAVTVLLIIGVTVAVNKVIEVDRDKAVNARSVSNLHQIGLAWMMYADDYNNKLPDLSDAQSMKEALARYLGKGSEKAFVHPRTGKPYQPNSSLSHQERRGPNASANFAVVYEDEPFVDGTRGVLFGDGHVERVTETRWQELKKTSNIP
jgi:prepilin-type processing-associated H-X9-DG protein